MHTTPAHALAATFCELVCAELSAEQLARLRHCNRSASRILCASHEFLDANAAMVRAFSEHGLADPMNATGPNKEAAAILWNDAWTIARRAQFNPDGVAFYAAA